MIVRIIEAAKKAKEIESKLTDKSEALIDHLIKLFLFPKSQTIEHWITDLHAIVHIVPRLTTKGHKLPSYKTIMDGIWDCGNTISIGIEDILDDYKNLNRSNITDNEVYNKVYNYCDWLAKELSKIGRVSKNQIREKVQDLIKDIEN